MDASFGVYPVSVVENIQQGKWHRGYAILRVVRTVYRDKMNVQPEGGPSEVPLGNRAEGVAG